MKPQTILACVGTVTVLSFFGCSSEEPKPPPDFVPGPVQTRAAQPEYPAGPYGVGKGSIIANYKFIGYANAVAKNDSMQEISLGDFYNPHGRDPAYQPASPAEDDRLFPPASQYGEGVKKPTVLQVTVSSVWCSPCNAEARCVLPAHYEKYSACGGGFFLQLQDGGTVGVPATPKNLYNWTVKSYKEEFPTAIDPAGRLGALFAADAVPQNFIIDLATMQIVEVIAGVPDDKYWEKYESLLADPTCPSQQQKCTSNADCATGKTCTTTCAAGTILCVPGACQAPGCSLQ